MQKEKKGNEDQKKKAVSLSEDQIKEVAGGRALPQPEVHKKHK